MSKQVTVEEGSASPPPLPKESIPESSTSASVASGSGTKRATDVPVATVAEGSNHEDEDENENATVGKDQEENVKQSADGEEEVWDPSEERLPGQPSSAKGKGKAVESDAGGQPWQAVWAAEQNGQSPIKIALRH